MSWGHPIGTAEDPVKIADIFIPHRQRHVLHLPVGAAQQEFGVFNAGLLFFLTKIHAVILQQDAVDLALGTMELLCQIFTGAFIFALAGKEHLNGMNIAGFRYHCRRRA